MKMAISLLQEYGLPLGLLPLAHVIEHKLVSYDTEINGYVQKNKIKKLKGVKAKELMLWPPVSEISVDDPPTAKIHFKRLLLQASNITITSYQLPLLESQAKLHSLILSLNSPINLSSFFFNYALSKYYYGKQRKRKHSKYVYHLGLK
ncbi:hypothetical protein PIB30_027633 [Stylosanthes scabra]|uniref:Uncharacterized protein n=1 Tax=Stylosanthes scabra TaxID=79078 RepID=A0ABU6QA79_9FABA|nr:hypothetical protein [Stylosanthes scabra]